MVSPCSLNGTKYDDQNDLRTESKWGKKTKELLVTEDTEKQGCTVKGRQRTEAFCKTFHIKLGLFRFPHRIWLQ
jgi:hypothetical protein